MEAEAAGGAAGKGIPPRHLPWSRVSMTLPARKLQDETVNSWRSQGNCPKSAPGHRAAHLSPVQGPRGSRATLLSLKFRETIGELEEGLPDLNPAVTRPWPLREDWACWGPLILADVPGWGARARSLCGQILGGLVCEMEASGWGRISKAARAPRARGVPSKDDPGGLGTRSWERSPAAPAR
jgi:hypothetical protein